MDPQTPKTLEGKIIHIVDGDTYDILFNVNFLNLQIVKRCRLYPVDTWEMRGANKELGKRAKRFAIDNFLGKNCVVKIHGIGSFERILSEITLEDGAPVNKLLSINGHLKE